MISKIHSICGVGTFKHFEPTSPIVLKKLNLIFSENGKGKSTIADMFRSMKSDEVERLAGRTSIGSDDQHVVLEVNRNRVVFENGNWTPRFNQVLVFDEVFVHENIYEGLSVDKEHRQNLFEVVVGSSAIKERIQRDSLTECITERRKTIRQLKESIAISIPQPVDLSCEAMTFDQFLELEPVDNVLQQIENQRNLVENLDDDNDVYKIDNFQRIRLPKSPTEELTSLLNRSLEYIESSAEQRIQEHFAEYTSATIEDWVQAGTEYVDEASERCPFCGLPLQNSHLIQHYQAYFSESYKQLKQDVLDFPETHLDVQTLMDELNATLTRNTQLIHTWSQQQITGLENIEIDYESVKECWSALVTEITKLLSQKQNAPLELVDGGEGIRPRLHDWREVSKAANEYNLAMERNRTMVKEFKSSVSSGILKDEVEKLYRLRCCEVRFSPRVLRHVHDYTNENVLVKQDVQSKSQLQSKINLAVESSFPVYRCKINEFLKALGASFGIGTFRKTSDRSSALFVDFNVSVAGREIPLGDDTTPVSSRSFRNVLSEGDKRTLALAFFLSQLDLMPDLEKKVVVFDDPVTSMDENRRNKTIFQIAQIRSRTTQIFVLSHRTDFLHSIWKRYGRKGKDADQTRCLKIQAMSDSSVIREWDIESAVATTNAKRFSRVLAFYVDPSIGDPDTISQDLRPLLEDYYKFCYADLCKCHRIDSLGDLVLFLNPDSSDRVVKRLAMTDKKQLCELNIVHRETHHGQQPQSPPLTETEVQHDCGIVLKLLGRREIE